MFLSVKKVSSAIPLFVPYQIGLPLVLLCFLLFPDQAILFFSYFLSFLQLLLCQNFLPSSLFLFRFLLLRLLSVIALCFLFEPFLLLPFLFFSPLLFFFR